MVNKVKGTQDILDLTLFNFLLEKAKKHFKNYNFTEIATPILEYLELFQRSLGDQTEVVSKEMYLVTTGKSEHDELICLRPEMTASIVRAFVNARIEQHPWKVFSWGPLFRHERPQKGRYRQFNQISLEIIGSSSVMQDVYFICMLDRFFTSLGLDHYALLINFLGCTDDQKSFQVILNGYLEEHGSHLCAGCLERKNKNSMRIFDCKSVTCRELYKTAPRIADYLCKICSDEWQELRDTLEQLSVSYSYAPNLVRGLDYYNKTVFEFVSGDLGAQNAFCAGGRYDNLVKELGATEDYPSLGAAIGMERVILMLEALKSNLKLAGNSPLYVIIPLVPVCSVLALMLADELHSEGFCVEVIVEEGSVKSRMRKADKLNAKAVLFIGEDERAAGTVKIKDMLSGNEMIVPQRDLLKLLDAKI
jgi:histidyl-tRNA synthetase